MRAYKDWSKEGLCRRILNARELFDTNPRKARKICANCPVAGDCLQYAMIYGERGIWGGLTFNQRQTIATRQPQYLRELIREAQNLGLFETRYSPADHQIEKRRQAQLEFSMPGVESGNRWE